MPNPNNCNTCNYKRMKETGQTDAQHCYMFFETPNEVCHQHTARKELSSGELFDQFFRSQAVE